MRRKRGKKSGGEESGGSRREGERRSGMKEKKRGRVEGRSWKGGEQLKEGEQKERE